MLNAIDVAINTHQQSGECVDKWGYIITYTHNKTLQQPKNNKNEHQWQQQTKAMHHFREQYCRNWSVRMWLQCNKRQHQRQSSIGNNIKLTTSQLLRLKDKQIEATPLSPLSPHLLIPSITSTIILHNCIPLAGVQSHLKASFVNLCCKLEGSFFDEMSLYTKHINISTKALIHSVVQSFTRLFIQSFIHLFMLYQKKYTYKNKEDESVDVAAKEDKWKE